MNNVCRHRIRLIVKACVVLVMLGIGYLYWLGFQQDRLERECAGAQDALASALIAIRDNDLSKLQSVMYSGSGDLVTAKYAHRGWRKMVAQNCETYDLKSLSDKQIRESVDIAEKQSVSLNSSILRWAVSPDEWNKLVEHPTDGLLVESHLSKHAVVAVCLKEHGEWKVVGLPCVSAKVLKYPTIDEASRHNDAIAE